MICGCYLVPFLLATLQKQVFEEGNRAASSNFINQSTHNWKDKLCEFHEGINNYALIITISKPNQRRSAVPYGFCGYFTIDLLASVT